MDTDNLRTKVTDESEYHPTVDGIYFTSVLTNSSHRDGAIYNNKLIQKEFLEVDIADCAESKSVSGPNDQISFAIFFMDSQMIIFFGNYILMNICADLFSFVGVGEPRDQSYFANLDWNLSQPRLG